MTEKRVPMRTCIACRTCKDKKELLRIVKTADGIRADVTGKLSGRGAYVCYDVNCVERMKKSRALNRAFSQEVDKSVYDEIAEVVSNETKG